MWHICPLPQARKGKVGCCASFPLDFPMKLFGTNLGPRSFTVAFCGSIMHTEVMPMHQTKCGFLKDT